jgi:hypothetical protein
MTQLFAIPAIEDLGAPCRVGAGPDRQNQAMVPPRDGRRCVLLDEPEQAASAPDVVRLAVEVFARRFALLLADLALLLADPAQLADGERAQRVDA